MARDLTAALEAATRAGSEPSSNVTITAPANYGDGRGNDLSAALDAATRAGSTTLTEKKLSEVRTPPAIPPRSGSAAPVAVPGSSGGSTGGGTWTETAYADRTYWSEQVFVTTDGMFAFKYPPIKSVKLKNGDDVQRIDQYKAPT